jgi:hypothetical protein
MSRLDVRGLISLALVAVLAAALLSCTGATAPPGQPPDQPSGEGSPSGQPSGGAPGAAASPDGRTFDFPTGAAVTVTEGYEPPSDRVASTGAHLPANGKPTLVFVDAIW